MRQRWQGWVAAVGAAATVAMSATPARSIVTQVDGQVLPLTNRMQAGLDRAVNQGGEGVSGAVDAINDAAVYPEVFLIPKLPSGDYRTVEFFDVLEGAGYENTFGWYNVEDPTTLYGVLTCDGDDANTNHEPGDSVTIDFQAEADAGRYLGGFVGFFLVSENNSSDDCGEASDLGVEEDFVVYTEAQLNGDGNYVHYLIYESVEIENTYYFGFEDLWRGGDNDFEDMLIRVTGLTQPCIPAPEVCDGEDNNCDGEVDNDPIDAGEPCVEIAGNDPGVGTCEAGTLVCEDGALVCQGEVGPETEICDGLDNDCDGEVDTDDATLDDPRLGEGCGNTGAGECEQGTATCILGTVICVNAVGPSPDFCDGLDNDCDGVVDGRVPTDGAAEPCNDDSDCPTEYPFCLPSSLVNETVCARGPRDAIGNCALDGAVCQGVRRCIDGSIECVEDTVGEEVCDGADNDCDGFVDEGNPGGGAECGPDDQNGEPISLEMANTGQCLPGILTCLGGELVCLDGRGPTVEICDWLDNDCDGEGDETAECPGENLCVEGKCAEPCGSGEFPCPGGLVCVKDYCVSPGSGTGGAGSGDGGAGNGDAGASTGATGTGATDGGNTSGEPGGSPPDGSGGRAGHVGTGNVPGQGPVEEHAWGLATGGGGASCAFSRLPNSGAALLLGLVGIGWMARRRRRSTTPAGRAS